jgi:DNA-binding transcriptional LysR family regulator
MSDRLQELAVFVRAAESGSFSRAGRELGLSQPSVSRIIGELEARLGVKLLLRTTRRITLTDAGALFLDRARDILAEIEDAEDAARGLDSLRGLIRLAIPVLYGTRAIIPLLSKFLTAHPLLRVELSVVDARQDLVAEGADVAIRLGELDDSTFGARKLATLQTMLAASPAYLAARGTPKTPADLANHDCIFGPGPFGRASWSFNRNGPRFQLMYAAASTSIRARLACKRAGGIGDCASIDRHGGRRDQGGPVGTALARLQAPFRRRACGVSRRTAALGQGSHAGRLSGAGAEIEVIAPTRAACCMGWRTAFSPGLSRHGLRRLGGKGWRAWPCSAPGRRASAAPCR